MKSRFSEEQIIGVETARGRVKTAGLCGNMGSARRRSTSGSRSSVEWK